jgi:hydroxymethylbilane synthase
MTGKGPDSKAIRIGSRGSQLALWQANSIAGSLHGLGHLTTIEIIRTAGDRLQGGDAPVPAGKGIFTSDIEEALLAGKIDLAVHSLKDLPTELADHFTLGAIPQRADPRDALVSERYASLEDLPTGAIVGTGSSRRQAQLRRARPDLQCIEFRGNVDTRLAKLAQGKADAIILAAAGLDRLCKAEWIRQRFSPEVLCPAAGQGALAIECRTDDRRTLAAVAPLDDRQTRRAVIAERRFLAALGGGCQMPIGAYAWTGSRSGPAGTTPFGAEKSVSGELSLMGVVLSADGSEMVAGEVHGSEPDEVADRLSQKLLAQGAAAIFSVAGGLA